MKWLRLTFFAAVVVAFPFVLSLGWEAYRSMGTAIPGTSVFRTYFDSAHGMAEISGTFDLSGGNKITVSCWSRGVIKRTENFDIFLHYTGYPGMPSPGHSLLQSVKLNAGDFRAAFDATMCANAVWIDSVSREQLRQISSAHEVVFDVGKGNSLTLHENQLTEIRGLITYTDSLPLDYSNITQITRIIALTLSSYARNHDGQYPIGKSSTEIFQQLVDQQYIYDPKLFYFPMTGKTEATTDKLKPENVCFDVTYPIHSDDPDSLPIVFTTGYKIDYSKGGDAHLLTNGDAMGIAVCLKDNMANFVRAKPDGILVTSPDFESKDRTYLQLTPEGQLP